MLTEVVSTPPTMPWLRCCQTVESRPRGGEEPAISSDRMPACFLGRAALLMPWIHRCTLMLAFPQSTGRHCCWGVGAAVNCCRFSPLTCSPDSSSPWAGGCPGWPRSPEASPGHPERSWGGTGCVSWAQQVGATVPGCLSSQEPSTFIAVSFSRSLSLHCVSGASSESTQLCCWGHPAFLFTVNHPVRYRYCWSDSANEQVQMLNNFLGSHVPKSEKCD